MKQVLLTAVAVVLVAAVVVPVHAGPPLNGVYQSTDLGGPVQLGRYTESWMGAGMPLAMGNTLNAQSWDGMNLGAEWKYYCGFVVMSQLLVSTVDGSGNGNATYMKTFSGGYSWLNGTGPWANGDVDYPGFITSYVEFETITYQSFQRIAAVSNVQASAQFDNYPSSCMTFAIGNMAEMGNTDTGMKPANYPGFLDPNTCDPTVTFGGWWDMFTLTLTISGCTVDTQDSTWGSVKSIYR